MPDPYRTRDPNDKVAPAQLEKRPLGPLRVEVRPSFASLRPTLGQWIAIGAWLTLGTVAGGVAGFVGALVVGVIATLINKDQLVLALFRRISLHGGGIVYRQWGRTGTVLFDDVDEVFVDVAEGGGWRSVRLREHSGAQHNLGLCWLEPSSGMKLLNAFTEECSLCHLESAKEVHGSRVATVLGEPSLTALPSRPSIPGMKRLGVFAGLAALCAWQASACSVSVKGRAHGSAAVQGGHAERPRPSPPHPSTPPKGTAPPKKPAPTAATSQAPPPPPRPPCLQDSASPRDGIAARELRGKEGIACALMADGSYRCTSRTVAGDQRYRSLFQGASWAQAPAARCAVLQDQRTLCFALDDRPCYAEAPALAGAKEIWESDSGTEFVLCARFEDGRVRCPFKPKRFSTHAVFTALEAERSPRDVVLLGDTEALIVRADGSLFAPTEPRHVPVPRPAPPSIAELVESQERVCARFDSGKVACWGRLSDGAEPGKLRYVVGLDDALSISLDGKAACAARKSGAAACWEVTGDKPAMKPSDPFGFSDVKGALASGGVRCVLRTDGSIWCLGSFNTVHKIEKPEKMTL